MRNLVLAVALALPASAAWAAEPAKEPTAAGQGAPGASCDAPAMGMCWDYVGLTRQDLDRTKTGCAQPGPGRGTWSEAKACPAAKRVGRCTRTMMGITTVINFYPPNTSKQAEDHCTMIGVAYTAG